MYRLNPELVEQMFEGLHVKATTVTILAETPRSWVCHLRHLYPSQYYLISLGHPVYIKPTAPGLPLPPILLVAPLPCPSPRTQRSKAIMGSIDTNTMGELAIDHIISQLSQNEKVSLLSGKSYTPHA